MHILKYTAFRRDGIFGTFTFAGDDHPIMVTLSHAFPVGGTYQPIVGQGTYTCVRGTHSLANGIPFETFEITGVAGHGGLLFHAGNFNADSHGCTLVGEKIATYANTGDEMVTNSKATFSAWMKRLEGVDSFMLQVI